MLSCCIRFTIIVIRLVSDEELIYLYRQGNDWALQELITRYEPIIYKGVYTSKKELENLGYDEAECLSKCYLNFVQCIDYYCEHKDVTFGAYVYLCLQYVVKNYNRRLCAPRYTHISYETLYENSDGLIVRDFRSNPRRVLEYQEWLDQLNQLSGKARGVEKAVLTCLVAGYAPRDLVRVLPYDAKTITNAVYRLRKKIKIMAEES